MRLESASQAIMTSNSSWYSDIKQTYSTALSLLEGYLDRINDLPQDVVETYEKETLARFIFESNNIERQGLPMGETRELVMSELENSPEAKEIFDFSQTIFNLYNSARPMMEEGLPDLEIALIEFGTKEEGKIDFGNVELRARYKSRTKEATIVMTHFAAATQGKAYALWNVGTRSIRARFDFFQVFTKHPNKQIAEKAKKEIFKNFPKGKPKYISLLTERKIKRLHLIIASTTLEKERLGKYRKKPIMIDLETHFPAPSQVPQAMKRFMKRFNQLEKEDLNPITLSALGSTEFVKIHPFSDFNGRISRLILNIVLRKYGLRFWVSLKSNSRDKRRYFTALRHYPRKKTSIGILIAMQIIDYINNFNEVLKQSGISPIEPKNVSYYAEFDEKTLYDLQMATPDTAIRRYATLIEAGEIPYPE